MIPAAVKVPDSLLLNQELSGSAKLLWMINRLDFQDQPAPGLLEARSGLARHTVLRGLAQLRAGGWLTVPACCRTASVPGDLLLEQRIGTPAKLLYGLLQLTPGFCPPTERVYLPG
jgi:hypothetical protein